MAIRVLHVIHDLRPGGTERRMLSLLATLDRDLFEPLLCCVDGLGALAKDVRELGVEPVVLGRSSRFDLRGVEKVARLVRRERVQIVHGWLDLANVIAGVGGRLGGAPVVIASEGATITTTDRGRRRVGAVADRMLSPLTDGFIANSHAVARALCARGVPQSKITVIHNGVAVPEWPTAQLRAEVRARLPVNEKSPLIGMVASLNADFKDHPTLLRAFAALRADRSDLRLAIVGDGPARESLTQLAVDLGVSDAVVFTGFRADATELLAAFDVSVLCSFSEGFSNVVLESMAWGRPVVATDIASSREAIDHRLHGLLVPVSEVNATADAIARLLDDRELATAFGKRARARVAIDFTLAAQAERTMALYDRLLRRKGRQTKRST